MSKKFGNRLLEIRNQMGLSQEGFSELVGLPKRTYQDIEYNKSDPSLETVMKIIKGLHISPDQLFEYQQDRSLSEFFTAWQKAEPKRREIALEILRGDETSTTKSKKA